MEKQSLMDLIMKRNEMTFLLRPPPQMLVVLAAPGRRGRNLTGVNPSHAGGTKDGVLALAGVGLATHAQVRMITPPHPAPNPWPPPRLRFCLCP